jgi:hypothetical protein
MNFSRRFPTSRRENNVGQTKRLVEETSTQLLKQRLNFLAHSSIVQCNMPTCMSKKCPTEMHHKPDEP